MPELADTPLENAYHELELLGFPLSLSMFDLLKTNYRGDVRTRDLKQYIGQVVRMVGQYVCEKNGAYEEQQNDVVRDFPGCRLRFF